MSQSLIFTVSQLNRYIKTTMDQDMVLQHVYLNAEISNFTNHIRSGHYYMTLKDDSASIRAVMFRESNRRLRFMPENGMRVLVRGRITVFERDGQYQFYLEDMQPDGVGALHLAFEQLKTRLAQEGLFDDAHKKPLPPFPKTIAVVTSPTGAALQDILTILARRWPVAKVLLTPVQVQGQQAAGQIAQAIAQINRDARADVLIVGRGGGSLEELWAFNEEIVARAVAGSEIPVISAVGHETDFSICDFAADMRAPTPSAAAELAVPDKAEQLARIAGLSISAKNAVTFALQKKRAVLESLQLRIGRQHPACILTEKRQLLDAATSALDRAMQTQFRQKQNVLALACGKLDTLSPLKILERGYAAVYKQGKPITQTGQLQPGDSLTLRFHTAQVLCRVEKVKEMETHGTAEHTTQF